MSHIDWQLEDAVFRATLAAIERRVKEAKEFVFDEPAISRIMETEGRLTTVFFLFKFLFK